MGIGQTRLKFFIAALLVIILLIIFAGFWLRGKKVSKQPRETTPENLIRSGVLFDSQSASVTGIIDKVADSKITITRKNLSDTFNLSPEVVVHRFDQSSQIATSSSGIKEITVGALATVLLEAVNNQYLVASITYPAPQVNPPLKPSPTQSPTDR